MGNTSSIAFKLALKGKGLVQYNGNKTPYIDYEGKDYASAKRENVSLAKYNFRKVGTRKAHDMQGKEYDKDIVKRELKYSSDFARHGIHAQEHRTSMPASVYEGDKELRIKHLANLGTLERGWLLPNNGKRKSPYVITDLKETSNAVIAVDVCSSTGEKTDTSLFGREQIGDSLFEGEGFIDVGEMSFISLSKLHDRMAITEDDYPEFAKELASNLAAARDRLSAKGYQLAAPESKIPEPGYYRKGEWDTTIPEKGIQLTEKQTMVLIIDLLDKMTGVYACKSQGAYVKTLALAVKEISNPAEENFNEGYSEFNANYAMKPLNLGYATDAEYEKLYSQSMSSIAKAEAKKKESKEEAAPETGKKAKKGK
jgi:hypothetical protein